MGAGPCTVVRAWISLFFVFAAGVCLTACDPRAAHDVTFSIVNRSERTLYLQSPGEPVLSRDGAAIGATFTSCGTVECGACGVFAECGRYLAQVIELGPGQAHEFVWDGKIQHLVNDGCPNQNQGCLERVTPPDGSLDAVTVHADAFIVDESLGAPDEYLEGPISEDSATLDYPAMSRLEIELH